MIKLLHPKSNPDAKRGPDKGKAVEKLTKDWLIARSAGDTGFAFHRYPDARAARGALGAQPSDFLVARQFKLTTQAEPVRRAYHLEVKETEQVLRLPKGKLRQFGVLQKFWWAGISVRLLVFRSVQNDWVYFTEQELFATEDCPASWPFLGKKTFPTHDAALTEIFG